MAGTKSFFLHCDFRAPMIGLPALAEESLELIAGRVLPAFQRGRAPHQFATNRKDEHAARTQ